MALTQSKSSMGSKMPPKQEEVASAMSPARRDNGSLMFIAFDGSDGVEKGNIPSPVEERSTSVR